MFVYTCAIIINVNIRVNHSSESKRYGESVKSHIHTSGECVKKSNDILQLDETMKFKKILRCPLLLLLCLSFQLYTSITSQSACISPKLILIRPQDLEICSGTINMMKYWSLKKVWWLLLRLLDKEIKSLPKIGRSGGILESIRNITEIVNKVQKDVLKTNIIFMFAFPLELGSEKWASSNCNGRIISIW